MITVISIERDYQIATETCYIVKASDLGFGSWKVRRLTIEAAFETVRHYYGLNHNTGLCGHRAGKNVEHSTRRKAALLGAVATNREEPTGR